jgi:DNA-binding IclR family transcriptional regulator
MPALKTRTAPALDRALTLLELLAQSRNGLTLPEMAAQADLPRSSVHYLLVTLERRGYLHRNERTSRYLFGQQVLTLANAVLPGLGVRQLAGPHLQRLAALTGLTAHLGVLEHNSAMVVAKHEASQSPRLPTWVGRRIHVHSTSLGKALIAFLPPEQLDELLDAHPLARHNQHTLASPRRLREELARVAERGHAVDNEEEELGLRCIGAPVWQSDVVVASVSVTGSIDDVFPQRVEDLARQVKAAAAAISLALSGGAAPERMRA